MADRGDVDAYSQLHSHLDIALGLVFIVVVCCRLLLLSEFLYRLRNFKGYDHRLMEHVAELEEKLVVAENCRLPLPYASNSAVRPTPDDNCPLSVASLNQAS